MPQNETARPPLRSGAGPGSQSLAATGPAPIPSDIRDASLAELQSGSWSGTWTRAGQTDGGARLERGRLTLPMAPPWPVRLALRDEGDGRFHGRVSSLGIGRRRGGRCRADGRDKLVLRSWRGLALADRDGAVRQEQEGKRELT